MSTQQQREVVIEIERIQVIRKRAKTRLLECVKCRGTVDFVPLDEAAELFEIDLADLLGFIQRNDCHYRTANTETIYLCVNSLLDRMKQFEGRRRLTA
jgi:hypothetical protein